ncbi:MAG: histidine kinase [Flavobacteriales bacterium]|nr:histidine kinase [Flavobacteriales bacterium]
MLRGIHLLALSACIVIGGPATAQPSEEGHITAYPLSVGGMREPLDLLVDANGYVWLLDERSVFCLMDGDPVRIWSCPDERTLSQFLGADAKGLHIATDALPWHVPLDGAEIVPVHLADPADPASTRLSDGTLVQLADSGWLHFQDHEKTWDLDLDLGRHTNLFQLEPGDHGRLVEDPGKGLWVMGRNGSVHVSFQRPLFEVYDAAEGLGKVTQVVDDTAADRRFILSIVRGLIVQRLSTGEPLNWWRTDVEGARLGGTKWRTMGGEHYFHGPLAIYRYDLAVDRPRKVLDLDQVLAGRTRDRRINDFELDEEQGFAFIGTKDNLLITFDPRTGRKAVREVKPEGSFSGIDLIVETAPFGSDQGLVLAEHGQFIADGFDGPVLPAQDRWPSFRFGPDFRAAGGCVVADTLVVVAGFTDGLFLYDIPRDSLYRPTGIQADRFLISDVFHDGMDLVYAVSREGLLMLDLRHGDLSLLRGSDGLPLENLYYRYMNVRRPGEMVLGLTDRYVRFRTRDLARTDEDGLFLEELTVNGLPLPGLPYRSIGYTWSTDHEHNSIGFRIGRARLDTPPFTKGYIRLDGKPGSVRFVNASEAIHFHSLAEGEHVLELGYAPDGPYFQAMVVDVLPPFWRRWWSIAAMALMLMLATALLVTWRSRVLRSKALMQAEYDARITELELSSLRARMHPHFIFNSLNSIKSFIAANEPRTATRYLNKFAQLVRSILNDSGKAEVDLRSELKGLELYLELERMRFDGSFDLHLQVDTAIDPDRVLVPPLIVQPYAENAIWHGLMHKTGDRKLTINVARENGSLHIVVRDNGIGREASRALNAMSARKHRSLGMSITKEVIARSGPGAGVEVKDLMDPEGPAGTEVHIRIPYRTS